MKHSTQVALFYEYWSQWALRENWYWEETSQRKAPPPLPTKAKSPFNLKERKRERTKERKKKKEKIQPQLPKSSEKYMVSFHYSQKEQFTPQISKRGFFGE